MNDVERYQRAGDYVFGLMDSAERARAERDLEQDLEFRLAVSALTARIRAADREIAARERRESGWESIAAGLAALPQMRGKIKAAADRETSNAAAPDGPSRRFQRHLLPAAALVVAFALGAAVGFSAGQAWPSAGSVVARVGDWLR